MISYILNTASCPAELQRGLSEICADQSDRFQNGKTSIKFVQTEDGNKKQHLSTRREGATIIIQYGQKIDAFRALGRLLGAADEQAQVFSETRRFDLFGVMLDVSRNGVLRVESTQALLRRFALMGLNMCLLYSEDTYEVPDEPFFGYLRGRYTESEIRAIDDCADALGIEMFPCIQTLGHLEQIIQWPVYTQNKDTEKVLLPEDEATLALIDRMITAASKPFRSKRIHIGMDEAVGVGSGVYKKKHGEKPPFEILNNHLNNVRKICQDKGLKPMIWSDMYFRLGSKDHEYYDKEWSIPENIVKDIPKDVQLVYWDYYHINQNFYETWIDHHRKLGSEPVVAGGVWTWGRLWPALDFTVATTDACMKACKAKNIKEIFATMWGDDGMECDYFTALPGVQYFAEHGYADTVDEQLLRANYRGTCGGEYDDFLLAEGLDSVPGTHPVTVASLNPIRGGSANSIHKSLLWQDPLLAIADPQFEQSPRAHYAALTQKLDEAATRKGPDPLLGFAAQISRVLELKSDLRRDLATAYKANDKKKLQAIVAGDLHNLRREVNVLWKQHRDRWTSVYKSFGWEVIEHRYGGLSARLETVADRIEAYLAGKLEKIEELEAELVRALPVPLDRFSGLTHSRLKTPSHIK